MSNSVGIGTFSFSRSFSDFIEYNIAIHTTDMISVEMFVSSNFEISSI